MRRIVLGSPMWSLCWLGVLAVGQRLPGRRRLPAVVTTSCSRGRWSRSSIDLCTDVKPRAFLRCCTRGRDQISPSVADFAIEFRTLATTCEWNEPALVARFLEGLNIDLREEIYAREPPAQFDQLVELAIRLEKCFEQWRRVRGSVSRQRTAFDSSVSRLEPEPMQLGGICLSPTERQWRIINRLCLYCGAAGHFASSCQLKARARQ